MTEFRILSNVQTENDGKEILKTELRKQRMIQLRDDKTEKTKLIKVN